VRFRAVRYRAITDAVRRKARGQDRHAETGPSRALLRAGCARDVVAAASIPTPEASRRPFRHPRRPAASAERALERTPLVASASRKAIVGPLPLRETEQR
jgi:hypothetical protein